MVKFSFIVKDELGLHARPAGQLVKEAAKCTSKVTLKKGEKTGDAKRIFNVMGLSVKGGDEVEVMVEGEKEQEEAAALEAFVLDNPGQILRCPTQRGRYDTTENGHK